MSKKAVCLISGGLDSTVAAAMAKDQGFDLIFLFINYGQKTLTKEKQCFDELVKVYQPSLVKYVDLPWVKELGGSALLDENTPLDEKNFLLEYVPFRNSIMLAVATALAEVTQSEAIFVGSTGGDHICPDNRPEFLEAFQKVIELGTLINKNIKIVAPLTTTDKTGGVKIGTALKVPFEHTWSCHNNIDQACGHCSNCLARLEAFSINHMSDPITYKLTTQNYAK